MNWKKITKDNLREATPSCKNTNYDLFEEFIRDNNVISFKYDIGNAVSLLRFFQNGGKSIGKETIYMREHYNQHYFADHYCFYKKANGEIIFVAQPYSTIEKIMYIYKSNLETNFDIKVFDSKDSWYNPNCTILFVIKLK